MSLSAKKTECVGVKGVFVSLAAQPKIDDMLRHNSRIILHGLVEQVDC